MLVHPSHHIFPWSPALPVLALFTNEMHRRQSKRLIILYTEETIEDDRRDHKGDSWL